MYSDGSHGGFNEYMRTSLGVLAMVSSEATNQLDPQFPASGRVDKKEYTDIKKLLECATGGPYRWTTATEERARRQAEVSCTELVTRSADGQQATSRRTSIYDQPIAFDSTNINMCQPCKVSHSMRTFTSIEYVMICYEDSFSLSQM